MSAVILPFPIFHVRIVREGSYPQDRASVLATTLISIVVRHLRTPELHAEIAQTLREEFPRHCAPSARRDPPQR